MRTNFTALFALAAFLGFGSTTVLAQRGQGHDAKPPKVASHPSNPHQGGGSSTHVQPTTHGSQPDHTRQPKSTGSTRKSPDHVTTTTTSTGTTSTTGTTSSGTTTSTGTSTSTETRVLTRSAQQLESNPKLSAKVQNLLGKDVDVIEAANGFRNLGQFVAAVHVSHNMGFSLEDFSKLKGYMTGANTGPSSTSAASSSSPMSLGQAVKKIRNTADVDTQVTTAQTQANQDMTTTGTK